jgi:PAS domain S-box-containing protein
MKRKERFWISLAAGLVVLIFVIWLTVAYPPHPGDLLPAFLFVVLLAFTTTFGVPLGGGQVSLLPMTTVATYLVLGPVLTAWVVFLGALIHGWVRYRWAGRLGERPRPGFQRVFGLAMANGALQTISILVAGLVYKWAGGVTPLADVHVSDIPALVLLGLTYLGLNLLMAGLYIAMRGLRALKLYLRSLPNLLLYEAWPMVFAPLMALVYTQLGLGQFALLALVLVIVSLGLRNLSLARQRLERRVSELDSLQAVGQALSASLDLDTILVAVHTQVARLMPARNFYVALYDPEMDKVSFPLAVEDGKRVRWRSRRAGNGLTEYVLRTCEPLLIEREYEGILEALEVDSIGRPAICWLGVPIMAGTAPLGVISVQSYSTHYAYDASHQEVLVTLAAQAAVAIQNARLYVRTDEALARRVQELDSILWTTQEGILLFDLDYRVLAANRALADLLGIAQLELAGEVLHIPRPEGASSIAALIDYTAEDLASDCQTLARGERDYRRHEIVVSGPPERHVERTLTPVRDRQGQITGWLLVLRDVTEERELALMREDLTGMLIHDLRSPLTVLMSSLELMKADLVEGTVQSFDDLIRLAEKSTSRLLLLVNNLLDISRLESGQMAVDPQAVDARTLLEVVVARLSPLATQAQIGLEISTEPDLPPVYVDLEIMDRVLHNLLDNAIKFTPDGGQVWLRARLDPLRDPATVLVSVRDSGPGIPLEAQGRLFKKFQQVVTNSSRRAGTGLGLPFCKLAVEAHGGEIWVESKVGTGSTFVVRLPTDKGVVQGSRDAV